MIGLLGTGGLLQFLGVSLVVLEIRSDRRLATGLISEQETESDPVTREVSHGADALLVKEGHVLTVEEQLRIHEAHHQLMEETTASSRAETLRMVDQSAREAEDRDEALRRFLHEQLTGGIGLRKTGVGLILAGIALTTGGGIWAAGA